MPVLPELSLAAADPETVATAFSSHEALTAALLILWVLLLFGAAMLVLLVMRYLRARRPSLTSKPAEVRRELRTPAVSVRAPEIQRWLAIRGTNQQAVLHTLALHNTRRGSWLEGCPDDLPHQLVVAPPLRGWIVVHGPALPDPAVDIDACFRFLNRLSVRVGEVQFFSFERRFHRHAWAWLDRGHALRGFAWDGRTLWNHGALTHAETDLGMICPEYDDPAEPEVIPGFDLVQLNADKVADLASRWSLAPADLTQFVPARNATIIGEVTRIRTA